MAVMAMFTVAIVAGQARGGSPAADTIAKEPVQVDFQTSLEQFDHAEMLFPVLDSIIDSPLHLKPLHINLDLNARSISIRLTDKGARRD